MNSVTWTLKNVNNDFIIFLETQRTNYIYTLTGTAVLV